MSQNRPKLYQVVHGKDGYTLFDGFLDSYSLIRKLCGLGCIVMSFLQGRILDARDNIYRLLFEKEKE